MNVDGGVGYKEAECGEWGHYQGMPYGKRIYGKK